LGTIDLYHSQIKPQSDIDMGLSLLGQATTSSDILMSGDNFDPTYITVGF